MATKKATAPIPVKDLEKKVVTVPFVKASVANVARNGKHFIGIFHADVSKELALDNTKFWVTQAQSDMILASGNYLNFAHFVLESGAYEGYTVDIEIVEMEAGLYVTKGGKEFTVDEDRIQSSVVGLNKPIAAAKDDLDQMRSVIGNVREMQMMQQLGLSAAPAATTPTTQKADDSGEPDLG